MDESRFISIAWSEGVTDEESAILTATVEQTLRWLYMRMPAAFERPPIKVRVFGNWVIPALEPDSPYWGTQWYIDASYDREVSRVIGPEYLELVRREPWQRMEPHFDLALIDQDLTDFPSPLARIRREHYALGTSFPGSMAVMSVRRLRALKDERMRHLALARLVRHHLGHVLGAPSYSREGEVTRLGLELHCTNPCVMRHAATAEDLARLSLEEAELGWPYCAQCTQDLYSVVVRHAYNWN